MEARLLAGRRDGHPGARVESSPVYQQFHLLRGLLTQMSVTARYLSALSDTRVRIQREFLSDSSGVELGGLSLAYSSESAHEVRMRTGATANRYNSADESQGFPACGNVYRWIP